MAKILIVEDDENIAKTVAATLSVVGYESSLCRTGEKALSTISDGGWDLILLDVMLPGMDGFEVIKHIDTEKYPVIFLTARQDVLDRVGGLKAGAEDYIVKPFEALELLARIEVVLRRSGKLQNVITYGDITVDISRHTAYHKRQPVSLTPKEFDVLVFFLQNQDIAVTRERLLCAVWGYNFEGESRTVDIHIQQIRKKLSLKNSLVTIPKLGYRLERKTP